MSLVLCVFFFFKQKTAYEMRISDWSSDVCSSDLMMHEAPFDHQPRRYSAAHEDAVIEDMRAMRAETYGDDVTDPAMDITPLGMVLLLASVFLMGMFIAFQIGG